MSEQIQHRWPAGFDPIEYPILARHYFCVEPRQATDIAGADVADLRRQRYGPFRRTLRQSLTTI